MGNHWFSAQACLNPRGFGSGPIARRRTVREYYSIRRLNPYLGVIQVVDVGHARAYSTDGAHWHPRSLTEEERERAGALADLARTTAGDNPMREALRERPPLPFPNGDRYELWLLHRGTKQPLALLRTERWAHNTQVECNPTWRPLLSGRPGFLARGGPSRTTATRAGREALETLIEFASRPRPAAQWFERSADGGGVGLGGLRIPEPLIGRRLPVSAFPELLCKEQWPTEHERWLVETFHDWHAVQLLAHRNLAAATRVRLERAAHMRPDGLLDNYRMFPEVLDPEGMQVALVAAKLTRSAGGARFAR